MRRAQALIEHTLQVAFVLLVACATNAHASPSPQSMELALRRSVADFASVIDPASQLAAAGCTARKEAITSAAELGRMSKAAAQAELDGAIERCAKLEWTFNRMRELHDLARVAIEQGQIGEASSKLEQLRAQWAGVGDDPGGGGS